MHSCEHWFIGEYAVRGNTIAWICVEAMRPTKGTIKSNYQCIHTVKVTYDGKYKWHMNWRLNIWVRGWSRDFSLLQEKKGKEWREHILLGGGQKGFHIIQESGPLQEIRSLIIWLTEMKIITFCLYRYHLALQNINPPLLLSNHMGLVKWTQLCFAFCFSTNKLWAYSHKICLCCFDFNVALFHLRYL